MTYSLRRPTTADMPVLGDICFRAFSAISEAHGFPPDMPHVAAATGLIGGLVEHPRFFGLAAEQDGRVIGSNFLDERGPISGVGPITVDPDVQNVGIGRALMAALIERSEARGAAGIRLVQAGYHNRSLALYLALGFEARAQLACVQGAPIERALAGYEVATAEMADLAACNALCRRVHGHDRSGELAEAIERGTATVARRAGRITAYASAVAFFGHMVGETDGDVMALIAAAPAINGAGILIPTANGALLRWCMGEGLRITQTMTLMSMGLYNEPQGTWLPSVLY